MTDALVQALVAFGSLLLGGGGYAAYVRAKGQNQTEFYRVAVDRITALESRSDEQDKRNEALVESNAKLLGKVGALEQENQNLGERLKVQRILTDELQIKVGQFEDEHEENIALRQTLQIEIAKRTFLEREVEQLRNEVAALREQLRKADARKSQESLHG